MGFSSLASVSPIFGIYQGEQKKKQSKRMAEQVRADAAAAARQADRASNMANMKQPNVAAMMKRNMDASSKGVGGTFLTGGGGAAVAPGMLGRTTLLGR